MVTFIKTDSKNIDFIKLVTLLDQDLRIRDGEEHAFYAQYNKIAMIHHVIIAYQNNQPVGCGAIKEYNGHTMEIKRMYVLPEKRNKGIAASVLQELENWATQLGYQKCILETGLKQPEAIRLYQKSGYESIPNYGQYQGIENSVCFQKIIS